MARLHPLPDRAAEAAAIAELRRTALASLADAQRPENGLHARAELAFDGVYLLRTSGDSPVQRRSRHAQVGRDLAAQHARVQQALG